MRLQMDEMRAALSEVTFMDTWEFELYLGTHEGVVLRITAMVPNAYNPAQLQELDIRTYVPPMDTVSQFLHWVLWRVERIMVHEAREWLKYKQRPICDPHRPGADRDGS